MKKRNLPWQIDLFTEKDGVFQYQSVSEKSEKPLLQEKSDLHIPAKIIQEYNASFPHNSLEHKQKSHEFHKDLEEKSQDFSRIRNQTQTSVNEVQNADSQENHKKISKNPEEYISEQQKTPKKQKEKTIKPKDTIVTFLMGVSSFEMKFSKKDSYLHDDADYQWVTIKIRRVGEPSFMKFEVGINMPKFRYSTWNDGSLYTVYEKAWEIDRIIRIDRWNQRFLNKNGEEIKNFQYFSYAFNVVRGVSVHNLITKEIWNHCRNVWISHNSHPGHDK